jgi:hypothetical protein
MAWNDADAWTRGDPAAPPHIKDFWLSPDWDSFPQRWTDETETEEHADWNPPYQWNAMTGEWDEGDVIDEQTF